MLQSISNLDKADLIGLFSRSSRKEEKPFTFEQMIRNIKTLRFSFIKEKRKMLNKIYQVKVSGVNNKSYLVNVYRSEMISLHKTVKKW